MADSSYIGGIHRKQGGTGLDVLSGSSVNFEAGSVLNVAGSLVYGTTGYAALAVTTETTATALKNSGVSLISTTTALGNNGYTIDAPAAGVMKLICCSASNSSDTVTVTASTAVSFDSGSKNKLVFNAPEDAVILMGISATRYYVVSNVGSVSISS